MTTFQPEKKLQELIELNHETEWLEFKHNNANPDEIGEYISALSNSAALHHQPFGYLIWGIENQTHRIIGTSFKPQITKAKGNEDLVPWLARLLNPQINFEIYEFSIDSHSIVLFQVQAANSQPISFAGKEYIRVGSYKKPLRDYPEKERTLWNYLSVKNHDWSAEICPEASLSNLDTDALNAAKKRYKDKHQKLHDEVDTWDEITFLNKAKITISGQITKTAIILLGKEETTQFLVPSAPQVTWILKDSQGHEIDYVHFHPPFILRVDDIYNKIRNLTLRVLGSHSLFPKEITKYDEWVIREALHNAIAHQDYTQGGRINIIEQDDCLLFTNRGNFIPGSIEKVLQQDAPEEIYRNNFLVQAMVNLNMIDTIGSGIKRMFRKQKDRFLPMPDYDLSEPDRVKVKIIGKILDERFTKLLMTRTDLELSDVILLDKVQKRQEIPDEAFRSLKRRGLIEGRKSKPIISATVAQVAGQEADYLHQRGSGREDCKQKVIDYLTQFGSAVRQKLEQLLFPMLSSQLTEAQKKDFVKNLIQEMKKDGLIQKATGSRTNAVWVLSKPKRGS
ncbi:MAG: putative DNA binding domain-containing protein [Gemmataceae bacterium]|jgi:ATP-dependent DNA helicase RecG|nr:putative DNA binding domain-containing protein [Gemmataceae bacterium]